MQTQICALKEENTVLSVPKTKDPILVLTTFLRREVRASEGTGRRDLSELAGTKVGTVMENIPERTE